MKTKIPRLIVIAHQSSLPVVDKAGDCCGTVSIHRFEKP